ncbi:hypothetical protein ZIOFF_060921 [Zingiber officinale]|uniref:CASP-like protein n=1 Tax=Zingiber officinale TaxID=94328 RepID=A0A8J5KLY9_ZINOF|nr:hypothetical protein ZIOFF_060921 [Zingiber officinale]
MARCSTPPSLVRRLCLLMDRLPSGPGKTELSTLLHFNATNNQLMTYIILVAGTVSTEILYLAYKGDVNVTWSEACSVLDTFCRRATTSVGITFGSTVCYVLLSLVSSYRLFSTFAAPLPFLSSKSQEIAAFPS